MLASLFTLNCQEINLDLGLNLHLGQNEKVMILCSDDPENMYIGQPIKAEQGNALTLAIGYAEV